jgi:large subunit ribosomal protein L21
VLQVPTIAVGAGERVELRDVLLLSDGDKITVGSPTVADALVVAEVVEHGKSRKVTNFKYKAKVRYRRKRGHRQGFTELRIREIQVDGKVVAEHKQQPRGASPTAPIGEQMAVQTGAEAASEAVSAQAAAAPAATPAVPAGRTARRRTAANAEPEATSVDATSVDATMEEITGSEAVEEAEEAQANTEADTAPPTGRRSRRTQE